MYIFSEIRARDVQKNFSPTRPGPCEPTGYNTLVQSQCGVLYVEQNARDKNKIHGYGYGSGEERK
jgi:hypothetical protein